MIIISLAQEMLIKIYVTDSDNWNESSITWNNAPFYGNSIAQKTVSSNDFINFDVSSVLIESPVPQITFVVTSESLSNLVIRSKENMDTALEDEYPHLIFIRDIVPGFDLYFINLLLSITMVLVGIKLKLNRQLELVS